MDEARIFTRKAVLGDVDDMCKLYLELPQRVRRMFHPYPFHPMRLRLVFFVMLTGQALLSVYKRIMPRLGFVIFVAEDNASKDILGFISLRLLGEESGKLVGGIGIVTREGLRSKGIGKKMYETMINYSTQIGVTKYRSIVLEENTASLEQCKKLGYKITGYAKDDNWKGEYMKNLILEMDLQIDH